MARRIGAAILMCAVMVLVAAVPLALAETHTVTKGDKGPRNSAVTWEYTPTDYGMWTGHIVNNGLRWLVVDVYDNSTGMPVQISHQRIRFAAYDAFPTGVVDTNGVIMAADRPYMVTVTPNGPKGSTCTVEDVFVPAMPPVAVISATMNYLTITVDASMSYDPDGTVVSYAWDFGDGAVSDAVSTEHVYAGPGDYTLTLVVTDNDGLEGMATEVVTPSLPAPPTASFTYTLVGNVLSVDASSSMAEGGIAYYTWNWGDGSPDEIVTQPTATHTYGTMAAPAVLVKAGAQTDAVIINQGPPPPPYNVFGYVTDSSGDPVFAASVTVTDVTTGTVWTTVSDDLYGYYIVDLNTQPTGWASGDTIRVDVVKGAMSGSNEGIAMSPGNEAYLWLDVTVQGAQMYTVTLMVTDMFGQTSTPVSVDIVV